MLLLSTLTLLTQTTARSGFMLPDWGVWLSIGVVLCLIELFIPKHLVGKFRLVPTIMGVNCAIVAFLLWRTTRYFAPNLQIMYWMFLCTAELLWFRPIFFSKQQKKFIVPNASEARTVTAILPGEVGRVIYEGTSWQARCEGPEPVAPNQTVYVLRREGNTLVVAPENLFKFDRN